MRARTFRAESMKRALDRVRAKLGSDAVILSARERRGRRLFGLAGTRDEVEITAKAADPTVPRRWVGTVRIDPGERLTEPRVSHEPDRPKEAEPREGCGGPTDRWRDHGARVLHASEWTALHGRVAALGVSEPAAGHLVRRVGELLSPSDLRDGELVEDALAQVLADMIPVAPPILALPRHRRSIAMVGPTGGGKTTTLAKLAASLKLLHGLNVAIVTLDTLRVGAPEQLKAYSEMIGVPFAVAATGADLRAACDQAGDVDLVLIDTPGLSPRDSERFAALLDTLAAVRPDETHLVASAAFQPAALRGFLKPWQSAPPDRLIVTKLDETNVLGGVLALIQEAMLPISYVTLGQAVPDDIEAADSDRLAAVILDARGGSEL